MALSESLCDILGAGIQKERAAHDFYRRAAGRTKHPLGKRMFDRLAGDESRHERILKDWSAGGGCPAGVEFPSPDPDLPSRGRAKAEAAVTPLADDLEAIEIARTMEREAVRFYAAAAEKAEAPPSKDLLLRLKAEEDKHLALLTDLYEYMKDPGLWSVRDERAHFDS